MIVCEKYFFRWMREVKRLDPSAIFLYDGGFITKLSLEKVAELIKTHGISRL